MPPSYQHACHLVPALRTRTFHFWYDIERLCGDHFRPSGFRQSATWWKESGTSVEGPERFFRICSARRKDGGKKVNVHCEVNVRLRIQKRKRSTFFPPGGTFPEKNISFLFWLITFSIFGMTSRDCAEITFDRRGSAKVPPRGKKAEARSRGLNAFSGNVPPGGKMAERRQMYITR